MADVTERLALGQLGTLLLDAGMSVTDVRSALVRIVPDGEHSHLGISVLPANVIVADATTATASVSKAVGVDLSLVQAARSHRLLRQLQQGRLPLDAVSAPIEAIRSDSMTRPALRWTLGSALVAAGLAVLFRCPWWSVAVATGIGAVVGVLTIAVRRLPGAVAILPFLATFVSTVGVGWIAHTLGYGAVPLFGVCAPIAILVPGALITNALLELTSVDIVTGTARLVYGLIMLGFMSAGIAAGAHVSELTINGDSAFLIGHTLSVSSLGAAWSALPPPWIAWVGVLLLGIGVGAAFGADRHLAIVTVLVMGCTYALLLAFGPLLGDVAATGLTAALLFVAARFVERRDYSAPAASYFQPAFLLLVPGTVGLVALTSVAGDAIVTALATFVGLCIGTKAGAIVADSVSLVRRTR